VQVAFEPALEGGQGFLLEQISERGGESGEADAVAAFESGLAMALASMDLPTPDWPRRRTLSPRSMKSRPSKRSMRRDRFAWVVPVETVDGLKAPRRRLGASGKVGGLPGTAFDDDQLFDGFAGTEMALMGVVKSAASASRGARKPRAARTRRDRWRAVRAQSSS